MPICPFVKKYIDKIAIVETNNFKASVNHLTQLMGPLGLEAVVLYGKELSYVTMKNITILMNKQYGKQDFEILFMHPDTEEAPLPLEYNFRIPLLILQRKSTLKNARKLLESKTKYYEYYK